MQLASEESAFSVFSATCGVAPALQLQGADKVDFRVRRRSAAEEEGMRIATFATTVGLALLGTVALAKSVILDTALRPEPAAA